MGKIAWIHQILVSNFLSALPMETGMKIWTTSAINAITLGTIGVGKGIGKVAESMTQAKLSAKFGETVINNIKNVGGFSTNEINSKIKQLNKLGMTQTTIDTLLKNPKFMLLGDDVLKFLGKQGGNQRLLAELVINNGDEFSKALLKTTVLYDFCDIVWKYGDNATKLLIAGDDVITTISKLDSKTISRLFDISSENNINDWANLIIKNNGLSYKEANIFDINGKNLTELDEVNFIEKIIYEDKNASGLYIDNPAVPQTEEQWATKQILKKGKNRVNALLQNNFKVTVETDTGEIIDYSFTISELKSIKDYVFRINEDTSELRIAVEDCLEQLRKLYPDFNFYAIYGV